MTVKKNRTQLARESSIGINTRLFTCMGCTYSRDLRSDSSFRNQVITLPGYGHISHAQLADADIAQHNCKKYVRRLLELRKIWDGNGSASTADRGSDRDVAVTSSALGSEFFA